MEEVGKYESIQDRIKRLTKNQPNTVSVSLNEQIQGSSLRSGLQEDSQKQNFSKMTFSKKRQNSQTCLRTLVTNKQLLTINQKLLEPVTNLIPQQLSHTVTKEIRKASHQYMIRKPAPVRESFEDHTSSQLDFTNSYTSQRRKDSAGCLGRDKYGRYDKYTGRGLVTEEDEEDGKKERNVLYQVNNKYQQQLVQGGLTGRATHGIKKSLTNLSYKMAECSQLNYRNSVGGQTITIKKPQIMKFSIPKDEAEFSYTKGAKDVKIPINTLDMVRTPEPRSRMLTKCKSGFIQRMPGKIIKNK